MANEAVTRYDAHPERILIIQNGRVVHQGGDGPLVYYDIQSVIDWLKKIDTRPAEAATFVDKVEEESECGA
jgi:phage terminase Nu1 subunit (DNA packaging protein)